MASLVSLYFHKTHKNIYNKGYKIFGFKEKISEKKESLIGLKMIMTSKSNPTPPKVITFYMHSSLLNARKSEIFTSPFCVESDYKLIF